MSLTPPRNQVLASPTPVWKVKVETCVHQSARQDAAALQYEFCLGTKKNCARSQEPLGRGKTDVAGAPGAAKGMHELPVWDWVRRRQVYQSGEVFPRNQEFDSANE